MTIYLSCSAGPLGLTGGDQNTLTVIGVSTVTLTLVGGEGTGQHINQGQTRIKLNLILWNQFNSWRSVIVDNQHFTGSYRDIISSLFGSLFISYQYIYL